MMTVLLSHDQGSGDTALHFAVAAQQFGAVQALVELGIDANVLNCKGQRALETGLENRNWLAVRYLGGKSSCFMFKSIIFTTTK